MFHSLLLLFPQRPADRLRLAHAEHGRRGAHQRPPDAGSALQEHQDQAAQPVGHQADPQDEERGRQPHVVSPALRPSPHIGPGTRCAQVPPAGRERRASSPGTQEREAPEFKMPPSPYRSRGTWPHVHVTNTRRDSNDNTTAKAGFGGGGGGVALQAV